MPSHSTEYTDSSFDDYISKAINDGVLDYVEKKAILEMKLQEMKADKLTALSSRVAQVEKVSDNNGEPPECVERPSRVLPKAFQAQFTKTLRNMEVSLKEIEIVLVRIEDSITQLKNAARIEKEQKKKALRCEGNNVREITSPLK